MSRGGIYISVFFMALIGGAIGEALVHGSAFAADKVFNAAYWAAMGAWVSGLFEAS